MKFLVLLAALSAAAISAPVMAQDSCAYGSARDCFDGRDRTDRKIRDDIANRTKLVATSTLDITDRKNRDDLANRTKIVAVSTADITDRKNRDDLTDRTLACP
jgi:hypothetical protein